MTHLIRIQRKRTKGWKMPEDTVYVGRPSKFGNPYQVGKIFDNKYPVTQEQAVAFYRDLMLTWRIGVVIEELAGKNLACWCALDEPCHADVLLELANNL